MSQGDVLADQFETHRRRMRGIAYRIVGSASDADDAVQDTWLRYNRSEITDIADLEAWLTTVVSRVSLNMLEARRSRPQPARDPEPPDEPTYDTDSDPEHRSMVADSIGTALTVVLDTLSPAERVAFVLHDIFAVPFDQIAPIVDRTTTATRQLASRGRARVRERDAGGQVDEVRKAVVVEAFLAASRQGDFDALMRLLDPEVVLRADERAVAYGTDSQAHGAQAVSRFSRYARGAHTVVLRGSAAAAWVVGTKVRVVYEFTIHDGRITAIDLIGDPGEHPGLELRIGEAW